MQCKLKFQYCTNTDVKRIQRGSRNVFDGEITEACASCRKSINGGFKLYKAAPEQKPRCYIAGKITGLPMDRVALKFTLAKQEVEAMGFTPVSPLDVDHSKHGQSWQEYMRADIRALLDCQAVYALRDWSKSPGATVEVNLAGGLHMQLIFQRAKKGTKRKK